MQHFSPKIPPDPLGREESVPKGSLSLIKGCVNQLGGPRSPTEAGRSELSSSRIREDSSHLPEAGNVWGKKQNSGISPKFLLHPERSSSLPDLGLRIVHFLGLQIFLQRIIFFCPSQLKERHRKRFGKIQRSLDVCVCVSLAPLLLWGMKRSDLMDWEGFSNLNAPGIPFC